MEHLSAPQLAAWLADPSRPRPFLLDVREQWEFDLCHLDGATLMQMNSIPARIDDLDEDAEIVCICHHGMRSMQVAAYLARQSEGQVFNLRGGVDAWSIEVDAALPRY